MFQRINRASVAAYVNAMLFIQSMKQSAQDLKEDERGLSGVVVAVLLILVAVLAIVMLWGSLSGWLGELWAKITGSGNSISGGTTF